jgi:DNA modification methylase
MIIDQKFGQNWAFYNADCVFGMRELLDRSVDFIVFSPPFLALYIYSDSVADLGNTDSEEQFFDGWRFHLDEMYRTLKSGGRMAVHCKDTMRYMSSHGYAGLYDFPGQIIRLCEQIGFNFERWVTIWKDPVIEMQRTKTYGLLHKSFSVRAEVTRQGCADYVLIFNKEDDKLNEQLPPINEQVIERMVHQWTNEGEYISTPLMKDIRGRLNKKVKKYQYSFFNLTDYSDSFIEQIRNQTSPGRLTSIHCTSQMMVNIIQQFENIKGWKFHSRLALTDGSYIVTFRNWKGEFENNVVKHSIQPPDVDYQLFERVYTETVQKNGGIEIIEEAVETWREPILRGTEYHPDYVGNNPPIGWRDGTYYSILLWQRYASPIWFDLDGLPESHPNCWMNINQTNVLNYRKAKSEEEEKHICPLQLDLIGLLLDEYTKKGDIVMSPYGGIGSEGYEAIKRYRKPILFELKPNYWQLGCKNLAIAEKEITQVRML